MTKIIMVKSDKTENKDQKVEKSSKKAIKSSYSKKKLKNILNGIAMFNQLSIIQLYQLLILTGMLYHGPQQDKKV